MDAETAAKQLVEVSYSEWKSLDKQSREMLARAVTQDANAAARVLVKTPDKRLRTLGTDVYNQLAQAAATTPETAARVLWGATDKRLHELGAETLRMLALSASQKAQEAALVLCEASDNTLLLLGREVIRELARSAASDPYSASRVLKDVVPVALAELNKEDVQALAYAAAQSAWTATYTLSRASDATFAFLDKACIRKLACAANEDAYAAAQILHATPTERLQAISMDILETIVEHVTQSQGLAWHVLSQISESAARVLGVDAINELARAVAYDKWQTRQLLQEAPPYILGMLSEETISTITPHYVYTEEIQYIYQERRCSVITMIPDEIHVNWPGKEELGERRQTVVAIFDEQTVAYDYFATLKGQNINAQIARFYHRYIVLAFTGSLPYTEFAVAALRLHQPLEFEVTDRNAHYMTSVELVINIVNNNVEVWCEWKERKLSATSEELATALKKLVSD